MPHTSPETRTISRKRQLNVVYFVDAAKTRSFRMPLTRVNIVFSVLGLLMLWSLCSVIWIFSLHEQRKDLVERLQSSLGTIFEYEARYNNVYEIAYPEQLGYDSTAGHADTKTSTEAVSKGDQKPSSADEGSGVVQRPAEEPKAEGPQDFPVTIENFAIESTPNSLELRFDISNQFKPDKAEGYVWAVADFHHADGRIESTGVPAGIQIKANGDPTYPRRSNKFAVRYFKRKKFTFTLDENAKGTFKLIRIGVLDSKTDKTKIYRMPIDVKTGG